MNAKKFLHKKDVAYMNRLSTSLDFDRIVSLMEEYAALRIQDVVKKSEQLICPVCGSDKTYKTEAIHCNRCAVTSAI